MSLGIDLKLLSKGVRPEQTNFGTKLFRLIQKADLYNRRLIQKGFPNAVKVYEHYLDTGYELYFWF